MKRCGRCWKCSGDYDLPVTHDRYGCEVCGKSRCECCVDVVDQCSLESCHEPIFDGQDWTTAPDGYRYHAECWAAEQAQEVLP